MQGKSKIRALLTEIRLNNGLSQREMSRRIGISHSTINDIENGKIKKVNIKIIIKLAEEFNINIKTLLIASGYEKLIYLLENNKKGWFDWKLK